MSAVRGSVVAPVLRVVVAVMIVVATGVGAAACGNDVSGAPAASTSSGATSAGALLAVAEFAAAADRPGTTILDVRTPEEFAAGHLDGAVNLDVEGAGFADAVAGLDPATSYAVYCRSGNRSAVAVSYLVDHGFDSVVHLDGGIVAWADAGRPVTTG